MVITKLKYLRIEYLILFLLCCTFKFATADFCLFWDTIACVSAPAQYLFDHQFSDFHFPVFFDTGDPQLLQCYLAMCWLIFGKSLLIAHLSMIPFVFGIAVLISWICKILFPGKQVWWVTILLLADPSLLSQCMMIGTDVLLILFSLAAIYSILRNKKWMLSISLLLLTLVSRRGMITCAGFMTGITIIEIWIKGRKINKTVLLDLSAHFAPAIVAVITFLLIRVYYYGWVVTNIHSPWYGTSHFVSFPEFIKNCLVVGKAFLDFGRLAWWILLFILVAKAGFSKVFSKKEHVLGIIFICLLFALLTVTLTITNPMGDRYFIVQYLCIALIVAKLSLTLFTRRQQLAAFVVVFISLFSGNFWIYPERIAESWDSTLAHLPYYELRKDVIHYFEERKIDYQEVGFGFPNTALIKYIEINDNPNRFQDIVPGINKYIVYSNIQNLDDERIDAIKSRYFRIKSFQKRGVYMDIYKLK